jgi:hypothetical protein
MPNSVPAAGPGLPNSPPHPPKRSRLADGFTGTAGQLIALAFDARNAQRSLDALRQQGRRSWLIRAERSSRLVPG